MRLSGSQVRCAVGHNSFIPATLPLIHFALWRKGRVRGGIRLGGSGGGRAERVPQGPSEWRKTRGVNLFEARSGGFKNRAGAQM